MKNEFKIGCNFQIITPPLETLLYGYVAKRPATSVHDDLRLNAIAVKQGELCGIMISADLCTVPENVVEKMRKAIQERTRVPKENISISAIHTHSGPAIKSAGGWGAANEEYINNILIPQSVKASEAALSNMKQAVLGVGTTESNVGVNRRELDENGNVILGQNPYGVFDKTMTVLAFRDLDGNPIVNLIHYGCHGTSAGRSTAITRDWSGYMVDRMKKETGAMTVFFNGAEGDAGPRLSNYRTVGDSDYNVENELIDEELSYMEEIGMLSAIDAMNAYRKIKEYRSVTFDIIKDTVILPYRSVPTLEEARAKLSELDAQEKLISVQFREHATLKETIRMYENNESFDPHMLINQIIFVFNSVVFVPFPFEMFSEIPLRIKQHSPFEHTLCLSNTNGANYYLPTQEQLVRGGYEIEIFLYANVNKLKNNTDDTIVAENLRILKNYK